MPCSDYYAVLGITRDANLETILRAYHARVFERHPDHNPRDPHATTAMCLLNEAIAVLRDTAKRQIYDSSLPSSSRCDWQAGDVEYCITITPQQAFTGTDVTLRFHTAHGQSYGVPIAVPPRAQPDGRIVVRGAGGPSLDRTQRGNLIAVIKIVA